MNIHIDHLSVSRVFVRCLSPAERRPTGCVSVNRSIETDEYPPSTSDVNAISMTRVDSMIRFTALNSTLKRT